MEEKLTPKIFLNKVLAGTATGIIVGLIPNAVLAAILKLFGENTLAVTITQMAVIFQLATPLLIGALIAVQFGFKPMQMLVVAGAAFVGSGVVKFNPDTATYIGAGTGDIHHQYHDYCINRCRHDLVDRRKIWVRGNCCNTNRCWYRRWSNRLLFISLRNQDYCRYR